MNEKIRNALLLVCVIIVLLIVIDMIFNFSGIGVEKFQSGAENAYAGGSSGGSNSGNGSRNTQLSDNQLDHTNIKSIISKKDGRIINVVFASDDPNNTTIIIPSPVNNSMNITVNSDGTLGEQISLSSAPRQRFRLRKIENAGELADFVGSTSLGANVNTSKFPFYVVTSMLPGFEDRCLAYEPGRLYVTAKANYDNQKWDVSNLRNPKKSVLTHTVTNNNVGSLNNANQNPVNDEHYDPNNIKINFNLSDELKRQLIGLNTEDGAANPNSSSNTRTRDHSQFYGQQCSTQLPADAISSLCPGCNPDRL